eukprot:tig00000215_g18653.t1
MLALRRQPWRSGGRRSAPARRLPAAARRARSAVIRIQAAAQRAARPCALPQRRWYTWKRRVRKVKERSAGKAQRRERERDRYPDREPDPAVVEKVVRLTTQARELLEDDASPEADARLKLAVDVATRELGPRHQITLAAMSALGDAYMQRRDLDNLGDAPQSPPLRSLDLGNHDKTKPPDSEEVIKATRALATALAARGDPKAAVAALEGSLEGLLGALGDGAGEGAAVGLLLGQLGALHADAASPAHDDLRAVACLEAAERALGASFGDGHPQAGLFCSSCPPLPSSARPAPPHPARHSIPAAC